MDEMPTAGWLLVWDVDPLGDCACPKRQHCPRPGKHPWVDKTPSGEMVGFTGGVMGAFDRLEEIPADWHQPGNRLAAVPGDSAVVFDLDSDRAWRTFVRYVALTLEPADFIAAAKTPRGHHVWAFTRTPGWSANAAGKWLRAWLGSGAGGLEFRIGIKSYVVWPDDHTRYWIPQDVFVRTVHQSMAQLPPETARTLSGMAPFWTATGDDVHDFQNKNNTDNAINELLHDLTDMDLDEARLRLDLACIRMAKASEGSRNNLLNLLSYFQGSAMIWIGGNAVRAEVISKLTKAATVAGTDGIAATIKSGINSGLRALQQADTKKKAEEAAADAAEAVAAGSEAVGAGV